MTRAKRTREILDTDRTTRSRSKSTASIPSKPAIFSELNAKGKSPTESPVSKRCKVRTRLSCGATPLSMNMQDKELLDTPIGAGIGTAMPVSMPTLVPQTEVNMDKCRAEIRKYIHAVRLRPECPELRSEYLRLKQTVDSNVAMARLEIRHDIVMELQDLLAEMEVVRTTNQEGELVLTPTVDDRVVHHIQEGLDQLPPYLEYADTIEEVIRRMTDIEDTVLPTMDSLQQRLEKLRTQVDSLDQNRDAKYKKCSEEINNIAFKMKALELRQARASPLMDMETLLARIDKLERNQTTSQSLSVCKDVEAISARLTKLEKGHPTQQGVSILIRDVDVLKNKVVSLSTLLESRNNSSPREPTHAGVETGGDQTADKAYIESIMNRHIVSIESMTSTPIDTGSEPLFLKDLYRNEIPRVERTASKLQDYLDKYVKIPSHDVTVRNKVLQELERVDTWIKDLRTAYSKDEVYNFAPQSREVASEIGTFAGDGEVVVYDFLKRFSTYTSAPTNQRADRLYHHHLSDAIRNRIPHLATDLNGIKKYLIAEYGRINHIVDQAAVQLEKKRGPSNPSIQQRFEILTAVTNTLTKLVNLGKHPEIDSQALDDYLCTETFISRVIKVMPEHYQEVFLKEISSKGLNARHISGKLSFEALLAFVRSSADSIERLAEDSSSKSKTVHNVFNKDTQQGVTEPPRTTPIPGVGGNIWGGKDFLFPCPISDHAHEIRDCTDFFELTPKERRDTIPPNRICKLCIRPRYICDSNPRNSCRDSIPRLLRCFDCEKRYKNFKTAPRFNVLYCFNPTHAKPSQVELRSALASYLGSTSTAMRAERIVVAACFKTTRSACACSSVTPNCSCHLSSKTSPPSPDSKAPAIDTRTGVRVAVPDAYIKREILQDSFYIMQTIRLGQSNCLLFYDKGANLNLIDGALAEKEGLQVISAQPTSIRVAGSTSVLTEYGRYRFLIGPTLDGLYHEITVQGMSQVTGEFSKYPLDDIARECRQVRGMEKEILPPFLGGGKVQLLIGINNPELDPIRLFTLPSGLAVYRSHLRDVYGSTICFGGPHPSFSRVNYERGSMAAIVMFSREVESFRSSVYGNSGISLLYTPTGKIAHNLEYKLPVSGCQFSVYPTPLLARDFQDLGCDITDDESDMESSDHQCIAGVYKALVPISKLRNMVDDGPDLSDEIAYRCHRCSKCQECKNSSKSRSLTLQEAQEQEVIENSVNIDEVNRKVVVDLPFMKEPVEFLTQKHGGPDNYSQALKVYISQCKKNDKVKEGMRKVHEELTQKGFMVRLKDLPSETQAIIKEAKFRHFFPWRTVFKEDSISTPVRMVVDPTMSHLNLILAKGTNSVASLMDILIANRTAPYSWSSDISKLYNMLQLKPAALPYSLFLYHESLDTKTPPEVWVMVVAWYGVLSTGNQAGFAIESLVTKFGSEFPMAVKPLEKARYVDDVAPGASSEGERETQIDHATQVLEKGGFKLKFVVRSGQPPCDKASTDGVSIKLLGYKWLPEADVLAPGLGELNFNKKKRGSKEPNKTPVVSREDAEDLLQNLVITRRIVVSKVSEFFDPLGIWEPLKLQLKLSMKSLVHLDWEDPLTPEDQETWKQRFVDYIDIPKVTAQRSVVNLDDGLKPIRLIGFSDAAHSAGGACVYAGVEQDDGTYTCRLLAAKSKLLHATIPRNELTALMLLTELMYIVKRAIGPRAKDFVYLTDSTVAMAWCQPSNRRLRLFVHNRVQTVKRMVEWTTGIEDNLPLYHISGTSNIADLLTKVHHISPEDIGIGTTWESGYPWMKLPLKSMPIKKYSEFVLTSEVTELAQSECFDEPYLLSSDTPSSVVIEPRSSHTLGTLYGINDGTNHLLKDHGIEHDSVTVSSHVVGTETRDRNLLLNIIKLGWDKSISILAHVLRFIDMCRHRIKTRNHLECSCKLCFYAPSMISERICYKKEVEQYLFRQESKVITKIVPVKERKNWTLQNGVYYYTTRLTEDRPFRTEDLDLDLAFFDGTDIVGVLPIVLSDSPILFSFLIFVHTIIRPHSGVEITSREVFKKMAVISGLRQIVKRIRKDCTHCRRILLKTVELQMGQHAAARTILSPPFYIVMIDIAMGFMANTFKNARKTVKIYALVIVCLLTSATNILALEGCETQDCCAAIERHASRYGVPSCIYVDSGTQLVALKKAEFSTTDFQTQMARKLDIEVKVSTAKAHNLQGRVENKIKIIRTTLEKMGSEAKSPMTTLGWETLFAKISSTIDDTPLARSNNSNAYDAGFEVLTPNRVKIGRNNFRPMSGGGIDLKMSSNLRNLMDRNQEIYKLWFRLYIDSIHLFMLRPSLWQASGRLPEVDDVVLFVFKEDVSQNKKYGEWKLGRVITAEPRRVELEYYCGTKKSGEVTKRRVFRSHRDVSILLTPEELAINSQSYYDRLKDPPNEQTE